MSIDDDKTISVEETTTQNSQEFKNTYKPIYDNDNIFSHRIDARSRTFFIDLKESQNGYFVRVSEKSRNGRKSTIMMDQEDVQEFIEAFKTIQQKIEIGKE